MLPPQPQVPFPVPAPSMQTRPAAINVFGILNLAFAVTGFFGLLFSFASMSLKNLAFYRDNPGVRMIEQIPGYQQIMQVSIWANLIITVLLTISGIGLLKLKPWARGLSIVYAVAAILRSIGISIAFYQVLLAPALKQNIDFKDPQSIGLLAGGISGTASGCFGVIYPVILIIFMNRRNIIDALQRGPVSGPPAMPQM